MKCSSIVKVLFILSFILVKVTGILPIHFNMSSKRFTVSWPEVAYTLTLTGFFVIAYSYIIEIFIGNMKAQYSQGGLVDLFLINFCRFLNFSIVVGYVSQVYNRNDLVKFLNDFFEHISILIKRLPQQINYKVLMVITVFRWTATSGTYALSVIQPMSFMKSSEPLDVLVACGSFAPYLIGTTLVTTYLAAALVLKHGYERIGRRLEAIAAEVKRTNRGFVDELTGLLHLYAKQNELLKLLERLCRNNVFFTTTAMFLTPLVVTYMQIIFAITSTKHQVPLDVTVIALSQLLNICMLLELVSIVKVFDWLIKAAKDVAKKLHNIELVLSDSRLEREAEIFSLVAFQDEPEITIYSMYKLDNPLLYGMCGTGTSYLIILIQFFVENNK